MTFGPEACWDCPVPLRTLLVIALSALLIAAAAGLLLALRSRVAYACGVLLLVALLLDVYVAAVQLRPGIDWRWRRVSDSENYVPWTAPLAFTGICLAALGCFRATHRAARSRTS